MAERRSSQIELGMLIQSVQTLTQEVSTLRSGVSEIFAWMNQAKGARRVVALTASLIGGVIGSIVTLIVHIFSK